MPLALSQVQVDSLLGASCTECEVWVDQGESPGCGLICYCFQPPLHCRLRVFNTSVLGLSIGVEDNEGFHTDFPLSLTFSDWMPVWKVNSRGDLANHVP